MAYTKGKSGNPGGRPSVKPWTDALRIELATQGGSDGVTGGLRAIARGVIAMAAKGDQAAYREIGDRLEGKPVQTVNTTIRDARQLTDAELIAVLQEGSGEGVAQSPPDSVLTH